MKATIAVLGVVLLVLMAIPQPARADFTDDCPRVGAYIARVEALIERTAPLIRHSGNERAMTLLRGAQAEIRLANIAYNRDRCRVAFRHAQTAEEMIIRALRIVRGDRPKD